MAISRGSDLSYRNVGVLRTNASDEIVPDTRGESGQMKELLIVADERQITRTKVFHTRLEFKLATFLSLHIRRTSKIFG